MAEATKTTGSNVIPLKEGIGPSFDCDYLFEQGDGVFTFRCDNYSHEYDGYLGFFRLLGYSPYSWKLQNVPRCWGPLLLWMGHTVESTVCHFSCDSHLDYTEAYRLSAFKREQLEIASVSRPELVHGLYCADTEWPLPMSAERKQRRKQFPVTCNGSFYRPEVQEYRDMLNLYMPDEHTTKCVLVPCSASKPYPSPLHRAVLDVLNDDWELIVCTGVLGLVPENLFAFAPEYDSGVPNLERCSETVSWYFTKHRYETVLVYSDFYAYAVKNGFDEIPDYHHGTVKYLFGNSWRDTYENLHLDVHLRRLEREVELA